MRFEPLACLTVLLYGLVLAAAGCNHDGDSGASSDLAADTAAPMDLGASLDLRGCPSLPACAVDPCKGANTGYECLRNDGLICRCGYGGQGLRPYCRPCDCPSTWQQAGAPGAGCSIEGLGCVYDFEQGCQCVFPERQFVCGGGMPPACPEKAPIPGSLCGGTVGGDCEFACGAADGVDCLCDNFHWKCVRLTDGGAAPVGDGGC